MLCVTLSRLTARALPTLFYGNSEERNFDPHEVINDYTSMSSDYLSSDTAADDNSYQTDDCFGMTDDAVIFRLHRIHELLTSWQCSWCLSVCHMA